MLVRDTKKVYRMEIESTVGKGASGKEVLDYMFGTWENDYNADTELVIKTWRSDTRTPLQRLNMFWAVPFTLLLSPFQFVFNGQIGWDTKTRLGRFILRATGHLNN